MDDQRFDAALRALQAGTTRRAGLAGALGALLGAGAAAATATATVGAAGKRDAARGVERPHGEGPCGDGSASANRCTKDKQCCTGVCDTQNRRCRCVKRGEACRQSKNCCNTMTCTNGVCVAGGPVDSKCSPATCKKGCCDGRTCVKATSASACGTGGAACVVCNGTSPICDGGTCRAGIWSYSAKFGTDGSGDSNFKFPGGVFVSADTLTAWVADQNNNRIAVWTRADNTSTTWSFSTKFGTSGSGDSNFSGPQGVVVSADSLTAWVADYGNNRISVWTRPDATSTAWSYSAQFGTSGSGDSNFAAPTGVFVSEDELTAWVVDSQNNRIAVWTRSSASSTTWSYSAQFGTSGSGDSNFSYPWGVFVSKDTRTAWVADTSNNRIAVWTRPTSSSTTWSYSAQFGTFGFGDSDFAAPRGVFVSEDELTAWVAEYINNRISVWTRPDSSSTTWSPSTRFGSSGAGDSNFNNPQGVVVSADARTAWVADKSNQRISIWALS